MPRQSSIRQKLLVGLTLLVVIVFGLSWSGFHGIYAYRSLVKNLSRRLGELPLASQLAQDMSDLRASLPGIDLEPADESAVAETTELAHVHEEFREQLQQVEDSLSAYRQHLSDNQLDGTAINDNSREREAVAKLQAALAGVRGVHQDVDWLLDRAQRSRVDAELAMMQRLAGALPRSLHQDFQAFYEDARVQYRTLIALGWSTLLGTLLLLGLLVLLFYRWIFAPLRVLITGSRHVAAGMFNYHIRLDTKDEMAELAEAMNAMTGRFRDIRDDLDRQVQLRTKEVVRSERLASVGFLAAGVAHEINNPLASIALCAESLEGRLRDVVNAGNPEHAVVLRYLQMIQDEAFRCKEITEKLLDFSRMGNLRRQATDLRRLVTDVVEMIGHLGKYQDRRVELLDGPAVVAWANPQEIKQVVLNIVANGLDSLEPGGAVIIELAERGAQAEMRFRDNGCGMTAETLEHLFEPFFTTRRNGQGTGLGLSITYRIVADHGGQITAHSAGPGQGAEFRVVLPVRETIEEHNHRHQAA